MIVGYFILSFILQFIYCDNSYENVPDAFLNISQIYDKYGYDFEEYKVETEDGYILGLFRVNSRKISTKPKPPILLTHGLMSSAESFMFAGPKKSLSYLLADANYDVWMANGRGSMHSRKHRTLNPDTDVNFWTFSWHEIGVYDLPANIDFILEKTGHEKIFYLGHSQGTTIFFVLASERPEYNEKIQLMIALAPSCFLKNMRNFGARVISPFYLLLDNLATSLNILEFIPLVSNSQLRIVERNLCVGNGLMRTICLILFNLIGGYDPQQLDESIIPFVVSTFPSGASARQLLHYAQSITNGNFQKYDYGPTENRKRYHSSTPPKYNLKQITAPVALFYADNDELNTEKDVRRLAGILQNVVEIYHVPHKQFTHNDFVWAKDIKPLVYNEVLRLLNNSQTL